MWERGERQWNEGGIPGQGCRGQSCWQARALRHTQGVVEEAAGPRHGCGVQEVGEDGKSAKWAWRVAGNSPREVRESRPASFIATLTRQPPPLTSTCSLQSAQVPQGTSGRLVRSVFGAKPSSGAQREKTWAEE